MLFGRSKVWAASFDGRAAVARGEEGDSWAADGEGKVVRAGIAGEEERGGFLELGQIAEGKLASEVFGWRWQECCEGGTDISLPCPSGDGEAGWFFGIQFFCDGGPVFDGPAFARAGRARVNNDKRLES